MFPVVGKGTFNKLIIKGFLWEPKTNKAIDCSPQPVDPVAEDNTYISHWTLHNVEPMTNNAWMTKNLKLDRQGT